MAELKPCPVCEKNPVLEAHNVLNIRTMEKRKMFCVYDFNCHIQTEPKNTEEEAIEDWNRRVDNGT